MEVKVERYRIQDWQDEETGLLIDENEDWILIMSIPVDYVTDGYKLISKKFLTERNRATAEMQIERVLNLRNISGEKPQGFKFGNTIEMLQWVEKAYEIFEFQEVSEDEVFYGKIHQIEDDEILTIDYIDSEGQEEIAYACDFDLAEIRTITFDTDYFNAVKLLWKDNKSQSNN